MSGRFQEIFRRCRLYFLQSSPLLCLALCKNEVKFFCAESLAFITTIPFSPLSSFETLLFDFKNGLVEQAIRPQKVIITLADEWLMRRTLTLYNELTESEVEELVILELSQCFSMPIEELYWDYKVEETLSVEPIITVTIVAVRVLDVLSLLEAVEACGLKVQRLGLNAEPHLPWNLLPWRLRNIKIKKMRWLGLLFSAVCLSFLFLYLLHTCFSQKINSQQLNNQRLVEEIAVLNQNFSQIKKLEVQKNTLLRQLYFMHYLQKKRFNMIHLCRILSQMLPAEAYLKRVKVKNKQVQLLGVSPDAKWIAVFLEKLKQVHTLSHVDLGFVRALKTQDAQEFQLFFVFRTFMHGQ